MTTGLAVVAAVGLAVVFAWAGAAKLARPGEVAASFAALGVPVPGVAARVVPAGELAVAVALLALPRLGGLAALVLLAPFTAVLARALRSPAPPPCACFGRASVRPVSGRDLVRNTALGLLALAVVVLG